MLEGGGDVSALETGDVLPHVAAEDLVEGRRLLAGVVQTLDGSGRQAVGRVSVQERPLEGLDEVPQKLVSVLLSAGDHQVCSLTQFHSVVFVKSRNVSLQTDSQSLLLLF